MRPLRRKGTKGLVHAVNQCDIEDKHLVCFSTKQATVLTVSALPQGNRERLTS